MDDDAGANCENEPADDVRRRDFLKYSIGTLSAVSMGPMAFADGGTPAAQRYPIDSHVVTTRERMISFPATLPGLAESQLCQVGQYAKHGYGAWTFGSGLPAIARADLMPAGYAQRMPAKKRKLLNFFAISDIHITDKEAPNQLILMQQAEPAAYNNTSIYSPVMMYTTQVLDAAIQTANALHRQDPFDFGISLGDTCNSTSYNELRWYLDLIDGKLITPSSGTHAGADRIDYQKPYQAAGLDKSIPWYQVLGNHDHFFIGSFPVDADPTLGLRESYVADTVWKVGDALTPSKANFPVLFNTEALKASPKYYMGFIDGSTPDGAIAGAGPAADPAFASGPPRVVADSDRRSLVRSEWIAEFFKTASLPVGHGFGLVDRSSPQGDADGFACYSFVPKAAVPLKIIVLDDTQSENDGSKDIHGHGYLDAKRWQWLQTELARGQAADQLMIVAAHVPIAVSAIGSETEWWTETKNIAPEHRNAVGIKELVDTLQGTPNLLLWVAGHRHLNTVKAFVSPDPATPEQGFWQVETASLRDFPQQFRTFEVYLNSDYTVSVVTTNVDPAVADGTPAATSRKYAIAVQQIVRNPVTFNGPNFRTAFGIPNGPLAPSMDPSRPQDGTPDPTIQFVDMGSAKSAFALPVPVHGSYNGELFKTLSPRMVEVLKHRFA